MLHEGVGTIHDRLEVALEPIHPRRRPFGVETQQRARHHGSARVHRQRHPSVHRLELEGSGRGLDQAPWHLHRHHVEVGAESAAHGRIQARVDPDAHQGAGRTAAGVAPLERLLGLNHGQPLAGLQSRDERLAGLGLGTALVAFGDRLHEERARPLPHAEAVATALRIEQEPILALHDVLLDVLPGQLQVEQVRRLSLGQQAGLEHHAAQRTDIHLQAQRRGQTVLRFAHQAAALHANATGHRMVVATQQVRPDRRSLGRGTEGIMDLELQHPCRV